MAHSTNMFSEDTDSMRFERNRLKTFRSWPTNAPVHPSDLAQAGFYYTGPGDKVQCAFTRCRLGQWEAGDIPHEEHAKHFPQCVFIRDPLSCGNIADLQTPVQESQSQPDIPLAHPSYQGYMQRLESFQSWPPTVTQTPEQFAEAGFFYTGTDDEVKCFCCDGGLRNWEPSDEPWVEHAKWFPGCQFIRMMRGEAAVEDVNRRFSEQAKRIGQIRANPEKGQRAADLMVKYINSRDVEQALSRGYSLPQVEEALTRRVQQTGQTFSDPMELILAMDNLNLSSRHQDTSRQDETFVKTPPSESSRFPPTQPRGAWYDKQQQGMREEQMEVTKINEETKKVKGHDGSDRELEALKKKVEALEDEKLCKICMDSQAAVVFLDCGHVVCCEGCSQMIRTCPACRGIIVKRVKIYKM